jgi:hypothetical protein
MPKSHDLGADTRQLYIQDALFGTTIQHASFISDIISVHNRNILTGWERSCTIKRPWTCRTLTPLMASTASMKHAVPVLV